MNFYRIQIVFSTMVSLWIATSRSIASDRMVPTIKEHSCRRIQSTLSPKEGLQHTRLIHIVYVFISNNNCNLFTIIIICFVYLNAHRILSSQRFSNQLFPPQLTVQQLIANNNVFVISHLFQTTLRVFQDVFGDILD